MAKRGLFARLFLTHLVVAVGALGALGVTADVVVERQSRSALLDRLEAQAGQARAAIDPADPSALQRVVDELGAASGTRFTVVRSDGVVLADSERDPTTMENHASRPEIAAALRGSTGTFTRRSETVGVAYVYLALPARDGIVVRAALPNATVVAARNAARVAVAITLVGLVAAAAILSALAARSVSRPLARITDQVERVARGEFRRVEPAGPAEARALASAVNAMADELAGRVDAIRRETELRDRILGSMDEAVILSRDGEVVYANRSATTFFGVEPGHPAPAVLTIDESARDIQVHHPVPRELRVASVPLADGTTLFVAQDVTQARRTDRIRRDFVANASHEMKTPVAGILATAETLQGAIGDDPEAARRFAETLAKEATRLSHLIEDLLDLARLEQPPDEEAAATDLVAIVRDAIEDVRARAGGKSIAIETAFSDRAAVRARGRDLDQLARNLLDNAVRYTPEGGRVDVTVRREDGTVVLEVGDTGIGIPQVDLPRVFERFYRVDPARARETGGTGLGLAIVRHVAESLGGSVSARSALGVGSTFTVSLPATD